MPDLIDLQNAHVTQLTKDGVKSEWLVRQNITSKDLATLPSRFSEEEVFAVMDMARKFELDALNAGIHFQKDRQNQVLISQNAELRNQLRACVEHSDRLAAKLESFIISEQ